MHTLRDKHQSAAGRRGGPASGFALALQLVLSTAMAMACVVTKLRAAIRWAMCALVALAVAACGESADPATSQASQPAQPATYTIGGLVNGLAPGATLMLANNNADPLTIAANGSFSFPAPVKANGSYAVTVASQPTGETCSVTDATGTGVTANVTNVKVVCSATTFVIGGTVSGLNAGAQLKLANNGADMLSITADGAFAFDTPVPFNGGYHVTIAAQPTGESCSVSNFAASGVTANVISIRVTCATTTFGVSGTISGLAAGLQVTLDDNGADPLTLTANGPFRFATAIPYQGSYAVTVGTQPVGQICSITGGSGGNVTADASGISVSCSTITLTIGGTLSGLEAGTQLTLTDNGGDALTLSANGSFTFATPIAFNGSYNVTINTPASGQTCTVSNGAGSGVTADVTSVGVSCVSRPEFAYVADVSGNRVLQYTIGAGGALTDQGAAPCRQEAARHRSRRCGLKDWAIRTRLQMPSNTLELAMPGYGHATSRHDECMSRKSRRIPSDNHAVKNTAAGAVRKKRARRHLRRLAV